MERVIKIAEKGPSFGTVRDVPSAETRVVYTQTRRVDVPAATLNKNRIVTGLENDAVTSAYKMLRTQVLHRMNAHGWTSLAVTSACAGDGKTVTAINLAISLAREVNHTVLLVDADLRRPSISHYFDYAPKFGLCDYLLKDIPLSEVLFNPGIERLVILPGGNSVANSSELLSSPRMVRLTEELKTRYPSRLILFDMPPLLAADDLLAFAPNLDSALLVVREGKTHKDELKAAMEMLKVVNVVGTVLNQAADALVGYY